MKKFLSIYLLLLLLSSRGVFAEGNDLALPEVAATPTPEVSSQGQDTSTTPIDVIETTPPPDMLESIVQDQKIGTSTASTTAQNGSDEGGIENIAQLQADKKVVRDTKSEGSKQMVKETPPDTSSKPAQTLSFNAVPAPYVDEGKSSVTSEGVPGDKSPKSQVAIPMPRPLTAISVPFEVLTKSAGQYYTYSGLSKPWTRTLLGLGFISLFISVILLRPKLLWRRFAQIQYLNPYPSPVDNSVVLFGDLKRLVSQLLHKRRGRSVFQRVSL